MVISDLVTDKEVGLESANSDKWCSCIDGALTNDNYIDRIRRAGFKNIEILQEYEIHTNDVNAFLNEECVGNITNADYSTLATDAYDAYVNFCVKRQTRPLDMAPFGKKLADKGIYNQRHKIGGQSEHYYNCMNLIRSMRSREQSSL
jgi:hypothetical protein